MNTAWTAYCANCGIGWQTYEIVNYNCPQCGSRMHGLTEIVLTEKLDLGPGWHRIVVLPEETETAEDVVEREIQRWRDGDESDMPEVDRSESTQDEVDAIRRELESILTPEFIEKAQQSYGYQLREAQQKYDNRVQEVRQAADDEYSRFIKAYFRNSAIPPLFRSPKPSHFMTICRWVASIWHWIRGK